MKKLFIFDCFGVILDTISISWMTNHYPKDLIKEKLSYFMPGLNEGTKTYHEAMLMIAKDLNMDINDVITSWISLGKPRMEILNKIKQLRHHGKTALLSNAPSGLVEMIFNNLGLNLNDYFDKVFISADYKLVKPNLNFYQVCLDSFDEKFDLITMTDDQEVNLKSVNQLNITPILYQNSEFVIKELSKLENK